jgi:predicted metal-dependent peptidase
MGGFVMEEMIKAKTQLLFKQPFFATLVYKLQFRENYNIPTMQTDSIHLDYNPDFVKTITIPETMGVISHEAMHCALNHCIPQRIGNRNIKKWGRAADYSVNPLVLNAGLTLPDGCLYDEQFFHKTTEHIYDLLPDQPSDEQPDQFTPGAFGEIVMPTNEDGTPLSSGELKQLEGEWKMAVKDATAIAKDQGCLPGNFEELIEELNQEPQVDWREEFRQFMTSSNKADYSWSRSNRRFVYQGIYLPSLYAPAMSTVVWAVDSSGSVGEDEFKAFGAEFNGVAEETQPESIWFMWCDTQLHGIEEITMDQMPIDKIKPIGRGGTHFNAPFEWVAEQGIYPECLVYLTDLYGKCTVDPPPYPVLWINTSPKKSQNDVPFGRVITIEA